MPHNVQNFGIATPKVEIIDAAPNINVADQVYSFDVSADMFPLLHNSPYLSPLLTEALIEEDLKTFSALHPSKRKEYVNNFLKLPNITNTNLASLTQNAIPYITWTPCSYTSATPAGKNFLLTYFKEFNKDIWDPDSIDIEGYKGPYYEDTVMALPVPPNDRLAIDNFAKKINEIAPVKDAQERSEDLVTMSAVQQSVTLDGLWWGLESNAFVTDQMPFWINIDKDDSPVTSPKHPTSLIISIGVGAAKNNQRYDLLLNMDSKPLLYDYLNPDAESDVPYKVREFDLDLSRVLKHEKRIEIGVMTAGGRLIISVNKNNLIYTRTDGDKLDNGGKILESRILASKVQVWGTNIRATINACPMTFAELSVIAFPIPTTKNVGGESETLTYKGVKWNGEAEGSVAHLPTQPSEKQQLYGVDCFEFLGDGGDAKPDGIGFHKLGTIRFVDSKIGGYSALESSGFYVLTMQPGDNSFKSADDKEYKIKNGGCPYFFRIKGTTKLETDAQGGTSTDVSSYVISISESANAPDFFHVKKSATVTFYNEGGVLNDILKTQKAIRIKWGWNENYTDTSFTGLITNLQMNETAGMETLTATCEDYFFILRNSPILNSPFYDGMVGVYAIMDLAKRAGCKNIQKSFSDEKDYFLPSGFAYTKPIMKFPSKQSLFDCIMDIVKRFEAYCYFDGEGRFTINKLPGGLFSGATTFVSEIYQDPNHATGENIILGEKNVTVDFSSTSNVISILTLDRNTRNAIVYATTAQKEINKDLLLFKKVLLTDQPALGELEVARKYAKDLAKRVFYPILKTNVKTIGGKFIQPLDFVKIMGQPFRVTSFKRSFSADNNDFSQDLECEWLGEL